MLNPDKKYLHSDGTDLPIMYVYLAGRIAGNCIDKCLEWRQKIIEFYSNYKGKGVYPISFLDALNSKEADSIDKLGLTSSIPPNLIYDKDILSVKRADVVVANMDDLFEATNIHCLDDDNTAYTDGFDYRQAYFQLSKAVLDRRPNWGTDFEVSIAMYLGKPTILIAGNERQKKMLELHPFMRRASVIVGSVEELLDGKYLNLLYKSIASSIY